MKIYLVGGAVRDKLLGIPVKEKDWVVVGASVKEMLKNGFIQVGKDFPVFLHPETKEEYALARTERKIGLGYTGFEFNTATNVSLEEDLKRRDITINAIAESPNGLIIDPYNGREDLKNKLLRHVSPAFSEDPVRILRVARFAARFGYTVAEDTLKLMQTMVENGEVNALVAERVWKEFERALQEPHPEKFFEVLVACHANNILFPNIAIPGPGINALLSAAQKTTRNTIRFAALTHVFSEAELLNLCERYRIPNEYRDLALLLIRNLSQYTKINQFTPEEILNFLLNVDAFRREERFNDFLLAWEVCSSISLSPWLYECYQEAKNINIQSLIAHLNGKEIAQKIKEKRLEAIKHYLEKYPLLDI